MAGHRAPFVLIVVTGAIPQTIDSRPIQPLQVRIVALALLALVIDGIDIQLLALVAPSILADWQIGRDMFGPAMAAALVGMAAGASLGGWASDRLGRRQVLVAATIVFGLATLAASRAGGVADMAAMRLVGGFGFGAAAPAAIALATEWLPRRNRTHIASLFSIGTPLGGMIGAAALLWLLPLFGWRGCFMLCGCLSLVIAALQFLLLPESPSFLIACGRREQAAASMARIGATALAEPDMPTGVGPIDRPLSLVSRVYLRLNIGIWGGYFCIAFISYAFAAWSPVLLTTAHFPMAFALKASMAFNLLAVIAATLAGPVVARHGSRGPLILSCLVALAMLGLMAWALASGRPPDGIVLRSVVLIASAGIGGATGCATAIIYGLVTLSYPTALRALGVGVGLMAGRIGGITTTLTGGALLALDGTSASPFLGILGGFGVLALMATLLIDRHLAPRAR